MQIAVVEIPTKEMGACRAIPDVGPLADWRGEPSASEPVAVGTEEVQVPRASGVFPAVRGADEWTSANDVWRWVPPSAAEAPAGCIRLVVFQRGASWPPFLARDLSDGVTTCIVAEAVGDGLSGLTQRVARRAESGNLPVTQLIWISGDTRRAAPVRSVRQLAETVGAAATVLVVQGHTPSSRRRDRVVTASVPSSEVHPWAVVATGSG